MRTEPSSVRITMARVDKILKGEAVGAQVTDHLSLASQVHGKNEAASRTAQEAVHDSIELGKARDHRAEMIRLEVP